MKKKRVAVLFGGKSSEHEVSLKSAEYIINNIEKEKYDIILIGITKQGVWYLYNGPVENISNGSWEESPDNKKVVLSQNTDSKGVLIITPNTQKYEFLSIDVIFPVLHGANGEDGTLQGLMELSTIPFVGCDTLSSAMCMDKVVTNIMLSYAKIDQAKFTWLIEKDFINDPESAVCKIEKELNSYPLFVKPANAGSSVGVSKAKNKQELLKAIKISLKEDHKVLIEECIQGKEVECAVLGNEKTIASVVGEIAPQTDFYDYDAKYNDNTTKLFIPARIDDKTAQKIKQTAQKAFEVMGCNGLARIDFFVQNGTNKVLLNELNTLPGFTSISMYPMLMKETGLNAKQLINKLILLAFERKEKIR